MSNEIDSTSKFGLIEYTAFGSLFGLSAIIGMYFGWYKGKQNSFDEYMLGGRNMKVFPIAVSLIASHISCITILGFPAEVYEFGTQLLVGCATVILVALVTNKIYLPIFFDLQLHSLYAYLELRFSKSVRLLASFIFLMSFLMYTPIVIYTPALAFNQASGVSVHVITPIICFLCIFYTTIGGLKAVVWTDTIQSVFTLLTILVVIFLGILDIGSVTQIIEINKRGERLEFFNFDTNIFSRTTFWSVFFGMFLLHMVMLTFHPGSTQRFSALSSKKAAKRSMIWYGVGSTMIFSLSVCMGLIMYAKYWNCDVIKSQKLQNSAQLLLYFIQEIALSYPGLTGIFISGLLSAALSTTSAGLNTLAGIVYEDFVTLCLPKQVSDQTSSIIMKIIVIVLGCLSILLVYVVEKLGPIMQVALSLAGVTNGALLTAFNLGIFFPWANTKGVLTGMIVSIILPLWMAIGAQLALSRKHLIFTGKPSNTSACMVNITSSVHPSQLPGYEEIANGIFAVHDLFFLYKISFLYYIPISSLTGIILGLLVSFCSGANDLMNMNPNLIAFPMRRFLKKSNHSLGKYDSIPQELSLFSKEPRK